VYSLCAKNVTLVVNPGPSIEAGVMLKGTSSCFAFSVSEANAPDLGGLSVMAFSTPANDKLFQIFQ
jgi:hypothetical protein